MTKCENMIHELYSKTKTIDEKIKNVLDTCKLTPFESKKIHDYLESNKKIQEFCRENIAKNVDEKKLENLIKITDEISNYADKLIAIEKSKKTKNGLTKRRVNEIIKPEYQKEETIENRKGCLDSLLKKQIIPIIAAVICTVILTNDINEWKNQKEDGVTDKNYLEWNLNRFKGRLSGLFGTRSIDINDEKELQSIAEDIQKDIASQGIDMSTSEIIEAVRLINFNENQAANAFENRNAILRATVNSGEIIGKLGSDTIVNKSGRSNYFIFEDDFKAMLANVTGNALTVNDFKTAKKVGGYDIYLVLDILVDGLNTENSKAFNYAKLFNEIVTNSVHNFTILETAPNETMYAILGTYNANRSRIVELSHGLSLGPIYGNGVDVNNRVEIDGTYGNICAEEIDKFVRIKKDDSNYSATQNNIFFGPELDKMLDASRSR